MFLIDLILDVLIHIGPMWLSAGPKCTQCGGDGIRPKKQADSNKHWHCRECCHEWISGRRQVTPATEKSAS